MNLSGSSFFSKNSSFLNCLKIEKSTIEKKISKKTDQNAKSNGYVLKKETIVTFILVRVHV